MLFLARDAKHTCLPPPPLFLIWAGLGNISFKLQTLLAFVEGVWTGTAAILLVQGSNKADRALSIIPGVECWTSEVLTTFWGLQRSELYEQFARNGLVINVEKFAVYLCTRLSRDLQDKKHALFFCNSASVCVVRNKYAHLFFETFPQTRVSLGPTGFYFSEVSNEDVCRFLEQDVNQMKNQQAKQSKFGVCALVCFVGATHTSVNPLVAGH
eukprot:1160759-Pelagomonas_calceolata.AAC.11